MESVCGHMCRGRFMRRCEPGKISSFLPKIPGFVNKGEAVWPPFLACKAHKIWIFGNLGKNSIITRYCGSHKNTLPDLVLFVVDVKMVI